MGRIYKRGSTYHCYGTTPTGAHFRVSLHTKDREVAKQRLRHLELGQTDPAPDQTQDLAKLLEAYLKTVDNPFTRSSYEQKARHLLRLLQGDLSESGLSSFLETRLAEGASRHTVYKELVVLRGALKLAKVKIDIPKFAAKYVPRKSYLTQHQLSTLCAVLPANRRPWVVWSAFTGSNLSELYKLRPEDVDLANSLVHIRGTKRAKRDRLIPLVPELKDWIHELPVEHWHNATRDLAGYCAKANIPRITSNDLRRTFASWLKQAGVDSKTVADLMGHESTRMVDLVYGQLSMDTYRAAVAKICATGVQISPPRVAPGDVSDADPDSTSG